MTVILTLIQTFFTSRINALKSRRQRGSVTIQEVIITSFYVLAATGVVAAIAVVIAHFTGLIHI